MAKTDTRRMVLAALILSVALLSACAMADEPTIIAFKAVDFVAQGGGDVQFPSGRQYPTFSHWDYNGHWLEWDIDVPQDGLYLTFAMYATGREQVPRRMFIDGEPVLDMVFWSTGDFRQYDFAFFEPVELKAGRRRIRLMVTAPEGEHAGINPAWFAFASPDILELEDDQIVQLIERHLGF